MRCFVVAECGINHLGNMDTAKQMIEEAEKAGADAVKFQYYDYADIAEEFEGKSAVLTALVQKSQLSLNQLAELEDYTRTVGLGWICTPFKRTRRVAEIAKLKPDAIKIRYKDYDGDTRLLEAAIRTSVPLVLVSCNTPGVDNMTLFWNPKIRWLSCIPKYPPDPSDFNWSRESAFHGFSDHYPHITASLMAASMTTQKEFIIEKHVMLSPQKAEEWANVPDANVSISFKELAELVKHLRLMEKLRPEQQVHWLPKHRG
jgi:N,N'-diacetyllegionaminate synthase